MRKSLAILTALSLTLAALPGPAATAAPGIAVAGESLAPASAVEPVQYRRHWRGPPPHRGGYYGPPRRGYYGPPPRYHGPRWRGPRRYYQGRYWRPSYDGWYVYNDGAWIAAAALGLAAGAALGAAAASPPAVVTGPPASVQSGAPVTRNGILPWTPAWYEYCGGKYKSFNPQTGLYLGYDGKYHYCQ